ncbi:MAG: hypothetical protein O2904_01120 [bacterium]|nr:hypothetical protein [bacterium]
MPLKHTTETLLVFLLGVAIAITGMLMSWLPSATESLVPWAIIFVLSLMYPLALGPLLRSNRADNDFRLLHWIPSVMLLLWLALDFLSTYVPQIATSVAWYVWGWTLPAVIVGFIMLIVFCLRVIRRRSIRIMLLALAFVPFVVGAVGSEKYDWNTQVADLLWQGDWWQVDLAIPGKDGLIAQKDDKNLQESSDSSEEAYRERLRALETRRDRIAARLQDRRNGNGNGNTLEGRVESSSSSSAYPVSVHYDQASSKPAHLPSSGFGWNAIVIMMAAAYCSVLQKRAQERVRG